MAVTPTHADQNGHILRSFDRSISQILGADMRLLYGLAIPILMIVDLIVLLALNPAKWLVAGIVVVELAALALVVVALMEMMSDDENDESPPVS